MEKYFEIEEGYKVKGDKVVRNITCIVIFLVLMALIWSSQKYTVELKKQGTVAGVIFIVLLMISPVRNNRTTRYNKVFRNMFSHIIITDNYIGEGNKNKVYRKIYKENISYFKVMKNGGIMVYSRYKLKRIFIPYQIEDCDSIIEILISWKIEQR